MSGDDKTRKEEAAQAPDCYWREFEIGTMRLLQAVVDDGQPGVVTRFPGTAKDGKTVDLVSPFTLSGDEIKFIQARYGWSGPRWITNWGIASTFTKEGSLYDEET